VNGHQRFTAGLGVNLSYPPGRLRSRRARMGHLVTATYPILLESSIVNTGEPARDVKESGK
jgi:hypothetical protein